MSYRLPRSVQVIIFSDTVEERQFLLLRRVTAADGSWGGFWQSVTGSLEDGESHIDAAIREVREETGFDATVSGLIDLGLVNTFEIAPQWRHKYAPGVVFNEEVCFALKVDGRDVTLDPIEHDAFVWVDYDEAVKMLNWDSNRRAFAALREVLQDEQPRSEDLDLRS